MAINKDAIPGDPPVAKARWDLDKLLKGAGPDADPTEINVFPANAVVGDLPEATAATEKSTTSQTYLKLKEIAIGRAGAYRIKFSLKAASTGQAYGWLYRNGVAVGTEQTTASTTYVIFSEDVSGWAKGDLCQIYVKSGVTNVLAYVKNFLTYSGNPIINTVTLD